jgi:uncharacterized protein (TIGR02646 family)
MIFVAFDSTAVPAELVRLWKLEKQQAVRRFARGIPKKSFAFTAYACEPCKAALKNHFRGKCAYCETRVLVGASGDIEHYRPKAMVIAPNGRKVCGYYWLAGEMSNLLLCCSNCNTRKRQHFRGATGVMMSGKGNEFPLADETKRATREGEEAGEYPLLINPYFDPPEEFLSFNADGQVAARRLRGHRLKKATESIRIYGLNREYLVRDREDHAKAVLGDIRHLLRAYERIKSGKRGFKQDLTEHWQAICGRLNLLSPYLGPTRQLVAELIPSKVRREIESMTKVMMPALSERRARPLIDRFVPDFQHGSMD